MATTKLNIGIGVALAIAVIAAVTLLLLPPAPVEAPTSADPETPTDTPASTTTEDESEPATSTENTDETEDEVIPVTHNDLIRVTTPLPETTISSPLTISGEARGTWFFEGSFPILLTNWDGLIIAEGYATAQGEWMTEEYVPFSATLTFTSDTSVSDRGSLILQKSNPSGLPENDDALEYTVYFE